MKIISFIILLLVSQYAIGADHDRKLIRMEIDGTTTWTGGRFTITQTTGSLNITASTISGHTIVAGDTLDMPSNGVYTQQNASGMHGTTGSGHIVIYGNGAYATSPLSSFQQSFWDDDQFLEVRGWKDSTWYGTHYTISNTHDCLFDHYVAVNGTGPTDTANASTGDWWHWDVNFSSAMVFTGSKSQTFYNNTYNGCRWSGFRAGILNLGSSWSGSDDNRSICLDWKLTNDTVKNIFNVWTGSGLNGTRIACLYGTAWGMEISGLYAKDILPSGLSYQQSHTTVVEIFGQTNLHDSWCFNSFAQFYRFYPLSWNGLPGYAGTTSFALAGLPNDGRKVSCYAWNIIDHIKNAYSDGELNQNNLGDRNSAHGINPLRDTCVNVTVHTTVRTIGSGTYYGFILDNVNQDTVYMGNCAIGAPEKDFTYSPGTRSNYEIATVSTASSNQTITNSSPFQQFTTSIVSDTISYIPVISGPLYNAGLVYSFRNHDIYGNPLNGTPDIGAVELQTGSPPSCTTNSSPTNGTTIGTQTTVTLVWNSAATATSYAVYGPYTGTPPGSPTYTTSSTSQAVTGLAAGTTYQWFVVPSNGSGSATGCSTSATSFTTATAPVTNPWKYLIINRRGAKP